MIFHIFNTYLYYDKHVLYNEFIYVINVFSSYFTLKHIFSSISVKFETTTVLHNNVIYYYVNHLQWSARMYLSIYGSIY